MSGHSSATERETSRIDGASVERGTSQHGDGDPSMRLHVLSVARLDIDSDRRPRLSPRQLPDVRMADERHLVTIWIEMSEVIDPTRSGPSRRFECVPQRSAVELQSPDIVSAVCVLTPRHHHAVLHRVVDGRVAEARRRARPRQVKARPSGVTLQRQRPSVSKPGGPIDSRLSPENQHAAIDRIIGRGVICPRNRSLTCRREPGPDLSPLSGGGLRAEPGALRPQRALGTSCESGRR